MTIHIPSELRPESYCGVECGTVIGAVRVNKPHLYRNSRDWEIPQYAVDIAESIMGPDIMFEGETVPETRS